MVEQTTEVVKQTTEVVEQSTVAILAQAIGAQIIHARMSSDHAAHLGALASFPGQLRRYASAVVLSSTQARRGRRDPEWQWQCSTPTVGATVMDHLRQLQGIWVLANIVPELLHRLLMHLVARIWWQRQDLPTARRQNAHKEAAATRITPNVEACVLRQTAATAVE